jgi:uncharacterized protein (UPF0333 family)
VILNLTDDHIAAVDIAFYFLLAAGDFGFGALSNCMAFYVAIQDFGNCSRWNFCILKSFDPAAGKSNSAVINVSKKLKKIIHNYFLFLIAKFLILLKQ